MAVVSCKRAAGILLLLCLAGWPGRSVWAQGRGDYSLAELADSASRHLPGLLGKQALVGSAEAAVREAKNSYLPRVNVVEEVSVGSANDVAGPFLPAPGVLHSISGSINGSQSYQAVTGNLASVYGEYDLVNFGLRGARVAGARAIAGEARADFERERYLIRWQVARVYFGILRNRYQLEVDSADIRRYQAMYTVSRALTGNGVNPGVDSSLAKAGLSRTRINYNQAMGNLRRLCQQLAYLTGLTDPGIRMDTSSGGRLRVAALSGDTAAVNVLTEYFVRRELRYGAEQELARKSYLPKVVAGAGGWARGSGDGLGYQRLNYLAGVGVVYDLFSGVHRRDRLAVLNGQIEAAGLELQQQRLSLQNQGSQADESIRVASRNLDELPVQLQAAADAYQQKLAQYKAGIVNLVELSNASFELLQAQTGYIEALNDWYTASLDKAALTGNLDQFLKSIK